MTPNLFDMTKEQYRLARKVDELRNRIKTRATELNVTCDHTDTAHFYVQNNQKFPSVTAKLELLKDKGLANWRLNKAIDYFYQHFPEMDSGNLLQHLDNAKNAGDTEFIGAGDIGRQVHGWREQWFSGIIGGEDMSNDPITIVLPSNSSSPVISCARAIQRFYTDHHYTPVACELSLADPSLNLGGQLDDLGFVDGELALVDLKTSNQGDKNAYFYQVALYYLMFVRAYKIRPKKAYVLHTSKTDGTYRLIPINNLPQLIKEAKMILRLSDALDRLTESKKKDKVTYGFTN